MIEKAISETISFMVKVLGIIILIPIALKIGLYCYNSIKGNKIKV